MNSENFTNVVPLPASGELSRDPTDHSYFIKKCMESIVCIPPFCFLVQGKLYNIWVLELSFLNLNCVDMKLITINLVTISFR